MRNLVRGFALLFLCFLNFQIVCSQTLFQNVYPGVYARLGSSARVIQSKDSCFIYAASFLNPTYHEIAMFKLDGSGDTIWTRTYGGISNDILVDIKSTPDGGCILLGSTNSFGSGLYDSYLIKTDSVGDTLWTRSIGTVKDDLPFSICLTSDSGYMVVGRSTGLSDSIYGTAFVMKVSNLGGIVWLREFQTAGKTFFCINPADNGSFIISGEDGAVLQIDSAGATMWYHKINASNAIKRYGITG